MRKIEKDRGKLDSHKLAITIWLINAFKSKSSWFWDDKSWITCFMIPIANRHASCTFHQFGLFACLSEWAYSMCLLIALQIAIAASFLKSFVIFLNYSNINKKEHVI